MDYKPTVLSEVEKRAYRSLLYYAMLDIRRLCRSGVPASKNPFQIWRQYHRSRLAGALADWLHNLALHSAEGLTKFNAEWFWDDFEVLRRRYPQFRAGQSWNYKKLYLSLLQREVLEN